MQQQEARCLRIAGLAVEDFVSIDDSSAVMSHGPALLMDCITSIVAIAAGAKSSKTATDHCCLACYLNRSQALAIRTCTASGLCRLTTSNTAAPLAQ
jgi:hypothetical protein